MSEISKLKKPLTIPNTILSVIFLMSKESLLGEGSFKSLLELVLCESRVAEGLVLEVGQAKEFLSFRVPLTPQAEEVFSHVKETLGRCQVRFVWMLLHDVVFSYVCESLHSPQVSFVGFGLDIYISISI